MTAYYRPSHIEHCNIGNESMPCTFVFHWADHDCGRMRRILRRRGNPHRASEQENITSHIPSRKWQHWLVIRKYWIFWNEFGPQQNAHDNATLLKAQEPRRVSVMRLDDLLVSFAMFHLIMTARQPSNEKTVARVELKFSF